MGRVRIGSRCCIVFPRCRLPAREATPSGLGRLRGVGSRRFVWRIDCPSRGSVRGDLFSSCRSDLCVVWTLKRRVVEIVCFQESESSNLTGSVWSCCQSLTVTSRRAVSQSRCSERPQRGFSEHERFERRRCQLGAGREAGERSGRVAVRCGGRAGRRGQPHAVGVAER